MRKIFLTDCRCNCRQWRGQTTSKHLSKSIKAVLLPYYIMSYLFRQYSYFLYFFDKILVKVLLLINTFRRGSFAHFFLWQRMGKFFDVDDLTLVVKILFHPFVPLLDPTIFVW